MLTMVCQVWVLDERHGAEDTNFSSKRQTQRVCIDGKVGKEESCSVFDKDDTYSGWNFPVLVYESFTWHPLMSCNFTSAKPLELISAQWTDGLDWICLGSAYLKASLTQPV